MMAVTYAPNVVEEAVLLAGRTAIAEDERAFRLERDRVYQIADADHRDAAFRRVHRKWFGRLVRQRAIEQAFDERPGLSDLLNECRVLRPRGDSRSFMHFSVGGVRSSAFWLLIFGDLLLAGAPTAKR